MISSGRVVEGKACHAIRSTKQGLPEERLHLLVARNAFDEAEVKFFFSNAPEKTPVTTLLLVAFSRGRVERCFKGQKQDIGFDAWEGRRYGGSSVI